MKEIKLLNNRILKIENNKENVILSLYENDKLIDCRKQKADFPFVARLDEVINHIVERMNIVDTEYDKMIDYHTNYKFLKKCLKFYIKGDILYGVGINNNLINFLIHRIKDYGEIKKKQDKKDNDIVIYEDEDYILIQKGAIRI